MNIDYVSIGRNPPEEVNAIIEVPIGGEPIKYELDKKAGTLVVDRLRVVAPLRATLNTLVMAGSYSAKGQERRREGLAAARFDGTSTHTEGQGHERKAGRGHCTDDAALVGKRRRGATTASNNQCGTES